MREITTREALREALIEEMERDPDVFLMGEEVGYYQGAYKVTQGLLERFGVKRVVDAPIAEAGFAGIGIGAAMTGLRPVIEFMTWNFSAVAFDQILNNAAKLRQMSGGQFTCPIVFRGPNGRVQGEWRLLLGGTPAFPDETGSFLWRFVREFRALRVFRGPIPFRASAFSACSAGGSVA
jgi:hypothetical protein